MTSVSKTTVSHNVLQQLSIARYQLSFYANNYILSNLQ